ncbi:hypothetical protein [Rhodococcoides kyotonense]|uniref:Phospholipase A2 n=1 Tax=Rhodococcoides kyotonense TaxID=398843 RepID=A0A239DGV4_9NOCA|nr:hypothetical protein [Rhodococcus kyotonensis]SNS31242.1 hypothetical protein SAMN05421642_101544 [Rhodococcus kyotonensis]
MTAKAKFATVLGICGAITLATPGALPTADASNTHAPAATVAIDALATDSAFDHLPPTFGEMFYAPTVENGVLINPAGDCSSPIPLPEEFGTACKAHDLGYDLIRYASATGESITPGAREIVDGSLRTAMHDACHSRDGIGSRTACYVMSDVASTAVDFNSWRQGYGNPAPEPALPYLLAGLVVSVGAAATSIALAVHARRRAGRA